jgi:predicted lipoprotein
VRTEALDQLQHGTVSDVDALGTDVRGMFALEWLLFGTAADALGDAAQSGDQSRRFALALAHNVEHYAALARDQLGDGTTLIARLQREPERGIGRFTQLSASSIEVLVHDRLEPLLQRGRRSPQLRGAVSGMSGALVGAQLAATERLYLGTTEPGHGLSLLVREAAPEIDLHLRAMFHTARVSVQTLGAPLSEVAIGEPQHIYAAHAALKELEKALKSELASALSMTLTFDAVDGD